jgi:chitodextrinase
MRHRNGIIILYEILYRPDSNFIDEWTTNTSDTTIVIEGLEPAKDYQFQIRAYTGRGSGQWSEQLQVRTASRTEFIAGGRHCDVSFTHYMAAYEIMPVF